MSDLFEQTVHVLVSLAMSAAAETLDDATLNREVDALVDVYLVWTRTRRPAGFRPQGYNERDELAQAFWEKVPPKQISERIRAGSLRETRVNAGDLCRQNTAECGLCWPAAVMLTPRRVDISTAEG